MRYGVRYGRDEKIGDAFAHFVSKSDALRFLAAISEAEPGIHFTAFEIKTNEVIS